MHALGGCLHCSCGTSRLMWCAPAPNRALSGTTNIVRAHLHLRMLFLELLGVLVQHEAVSALPKIITTGFRSIQLIYFFTAGEDEVKCWQIRKGTKAPQVCNGAAYFSLSQEKHGNSQRSWTVHWSFHYSTALLNSSTQCRQ